MWSVECGVVVTLRFAPPAAQCLRCQLAGVAALRSALHSYRTFVTRGLYLIDRCGFAKCGMWKVEFGIVVTLRFLPAGRRFV